MSFLLDTCTVSEAVKPAPNPGWRAWMAATPKAAMFVSVASAAEIQLGILRLAPGVRRETLHLWFASLPAEFAGHLLPADLPVALSWATIGAHRARMGRPITPMDAFIAATAQVHGLTLVTRNTADFEDADIALFNPWT